jgi:hypothetical protein
MLPDISQLSNDDLKGNPEFLSVTSYDSRSKSTDIKNSSVGSYKFSTCGFSNDGNKIRPEYLVRIKDYRQRMIVLGVLQENITMRAETFWEQFIPTAISDTADSVVQFISGGTMSLVTKATQRRKWKGTTPIEITMNLKFEALDDAYKNVVQPCKVLQSLALPSQGVASEELRSWSDVRQALPFLAPPGPSPFTWVGVLNIADPGAKKRSEDEIVQHLRGGDLIVINIGRFLTFYNVILKVPIVEFHNKFTKNGDPVAANVSLTFETYEISTVEDLEQSYNKTNLMDKS